MKIRNKILVYFSTTVIFLTGISFIIIYALFYEYREESFQQQQNKKIHTTIGLLKKFKQESSEIVSLLDKQDINDFYDEKLLIYDEDKNLIFASLDNLNITGAATILGNLSRTNNWIETREGDYDVIGTFIESNNQGYYAISKAYDAFGYDKLSFLRNILVAMFVGIGIVVFLVSQYIAGKISKPITLLNEEIVKFDLSGENFKELRIETNSFELRQLSRRFNDLLKKTNEAFTFQKHTAHHISHQLKTPVAVLVSELERIRNYSDIEKIKQELDSQIIKAKSLGNIINVLLAISKIESGQQIRKQDLRIDELIFDTIEELKSIYPDFHFDVNYTPDEIDEQRLVIHFNTVLIRQVIQNLLTNCILHSRDLHAEIIFNCTSERELKVRFINSGKPISKDEEKFLFRHFFRGKNSEGKAGFGLGLVLTKKILDVNDATIAYFNPETDVNVFELTFPLS